MARAVGPAHRFLAARPAPFRQYHIGIADRHHNVVCVLHEPNPDCGRPGRIEHVIADMKQRSVIVPLRVQFSCGGYSYILLFAYISGFRPATYGGAFRSRTGRNSATPHLLLIILQTLHGKVG